MRPFGDLVAKEDALARLLAAARPVARVEEVELRAARDRVCAEDVRAPFAVPPFARATMDGYAVRASDGASARRVVGEGFAGAAAGRVGAGEARRIATGAPLPEGADAVVRVEDASERDGVVTITAAPRAGLFVDPAGADLALGARVVAEGDALTPARLGLLASVGRARVRVFARPRVAVVSTGDELLKPGDAPRADRIFDSNTTTLAALFESLGCDVSTGGPLGDDLAAQRATMRDAAARHDLVVLTGGASVGAKDLAADALRAEGEVLFHGVRVKPGKPLLAGRVGDALVVGLPGNPTSALSNAIIFLAPVARRLARLPPQGARTVTATLAARVQGEGQRFLFLPVKLADGRAVPTFKGSGALTSLADSDGWVGVPEGATLEAGAPVVVTLW